MADLSSRKIPKGDTGDWVATFDGLVDEIEAGITETENARDGQATLLAKNQQQDNRLSAIETEVSVARGGYVDVAARQDAQDDRQDTQEATSASISNRLIAAETYLEQNSDFDADNPILINPSTISADTTIAAGNNAMSIGPMTTASGVTIDILGTYTTI